MELRHVLVAQSPPERILGRREIREDESDVDLCRNISEAVRLRRVRNPVVPGAEVGHLQACAGEWAGDHGVSSGFNG
ncbi:hypothetical protein FM106_09785 [Brachybacterium faecium]|nr:hypothetical protein FM106_09785 [Brachybacterium faecium]